MNGELNRLWDLHFASDWPGELCAFNDRLRGLTDSRFYLPHPQCSPAWINGDFTKMKPGAWVLVVGLNPHLNLNDNKIAQESIHCSGDWQTFWRDFNRDRRHWGSRYFQTWGRVASRAMGLDLTANESNDFVEQGVMFVEFCPYASPSWPAAQQVKWEQWKSIADQEGNPGVEDVSAPAIRMGPAWLGSM